MRGGVVALAMLALSLSASSPARAKGADGMTFLGFRAFVVQPDTAWWEWDAAIYGALEERGFEVTYGGTRAAREAATRRALAGVEAEWLAFYRDEILTGDARFTVIGGTVGRDELRLRARNTGRQVRPRLQGELAVDLPPPAGD